METSGRPPSLLDFLLAQIHLSIVQKINATEIFKITTIHYNEVKFMNVHDQEMTKLMNKMNMRLMDEEEKLKNIHVNDDEIFINIHVDDDEIFINIHVDDDEIFINILCR